MKKLICVLFIMIMVVISLAGCNCNISAAEDIHFEKLSYVDQMGGYRISYYRDVKTDIIYMLTSDMDYGGISPLYNADGEPMTYDKFMEEIAK